MISPVNSLRFEVAVRESRSCAAQRFRARRICLSRRRYYTPRRRMNRVLVGMLEQQELQRQAAEERRRELLEWQYQCMGY